eukprot:5669117-Amphidinium_carterae.1
MTELPNAPSGSVCLILDTAYSHRKHLETHLCANLAWQSETEQFTFGSGGSVSNRRNVVVLAIPGSDEEILTSFSEVPCRLPLLASRPWLES